MNFFVNSSSAMVGGAGSLLRSGVVVTVASVVSSLDRNLSLDRSRSTQRHRVIAGHLNLIPNVDIRTIDFLSQKNNHGRAMEQKKQVAR